MSFQECLVSRKDCSGKGQPLSISKVKDICKSTHQAAPLKSLFVILPKGLDYESGIYKYNKDGLNLISNEEKTNYIMELYPELILNVPIQFEELIRVGVTWQYLSLKAESMGFGVSQRARAPKKINRIINNITQKDHIFLYSVAVRERDRDMLMEDTSDPLNIKDIEEGIYLLDTPLCYRNRAIYKNKYEGIPLDNVIFNKIEKKHSNPNSLNEVSQLLWACQGETDHFTHGNRDVLEKNGYGRVHASGCAGYAVYPLLIVDKIMNLEKGAYLYNPIGFSGLNRWIQANGNISYDHFIQRFTSEDLKSKIENEFGIDFSNYLILLCIDKKKPCSGFMHRKVMDTTYWAEIEAGMALAGLQLQANALGLQWKKKIISNPDDTKYRSLFQLDKAENSINIIAKTIVNLPKNEKLSLKGNLEPLVLFY